MRLFYYLWLLAIFIKLINNLYFYSAISVLSVTDNIQQKKNSTSEVITTTTLRCRLVFGMLLYLALVNMLVMASIALYRFITVLYPRISKTYLTVKATLLGLAFNWLLPTAFIVPPVLGAWGKFTYDNITSACVLELIPTEEDEQQANYPLFIFLFGMTVPTTIMALCYCAIAYRIHQTSKRVRIHAQRSAASSTTGGTDSTPLPSQGNQYSDIIPIVGHTGHGQRQVINAPLYNSNVSHNVKNINTRVKPQSSVASKKEKKITKIFGIIVIIYIISYFPYLTLSLAINLSRTQISPLIYHCTVFFTYISSISNPFVFLAHNYKFKSRINKLFRRSTSKRKNQHLKVRKPFNRVIHVQEIAF